MTHNCNINFAEGECSDGMCCFTCVIPSKNRHLDFFKLFWRNGTGATCVKLLVVSEGLKNELYEACKFLDFTISRRSDDDTLKMDLRCSIYKSRPSQCVGYPDRAGESLYNKISGPCIFNEFTAPIAYKKLVYKRDWQSFYAILDDVNVFRRIFVNEDPMTARDLILKARDVRTATVSSGTDELECILIPIPRQTQNILYSSESHQPITTIRQAYSMWEEKIQKNLQNNYGHEWETMLNNAIETEEKDAGKGNNEDTASNAEC